MEIYIAIIVTVTLLISIFRLFMDIYKIRVLNALLDMKQEIINLANSGYKLNRKAARFFSLIDQSEDVDFNQ